MDSEENKKLQTIEEAIDKAYHDLFDLICDKHDSLYELKIVYQEDTGKTIIRSWRDRNKIIRQEELDSLETEAAREKLRSARDK